MDNNRSAYHEIKAVLKKTAAEILNKSLSEIQEDSPFSEYGLRGLLINQYIEQINEIYSVTIKIPDFFSFPTVSALSSEVAKRLSERGSLSPQRDFSRENNGNENKGVYEEPVAVIGMSGRFGSAENIDEFWTVLKEGKSLIEEVPPARWSTDKYFSADKKDAWKTYSKWGSFLRNIDQFDPSFFRISGRDAEVMDPQHRIFLEESWRALEDAGVQPESLKSLRCGVFATSAQSDYIGQKSEVASSWWGNDPAILPARISYFLDTKGPAVAVDTACSSSLTTIHLACSSLKSGESDMAIAGGIWISTRHFFYNRASRAKMLSPDGQCYTFDERANGFVPGEAAGVLILKRLKDAERDGDRIHAVIKGTYTNQDGSTNGITAPSGLAQQKLMREAFEKYQINPETIGNVEAHGTGTRLGDPVEFEALDKVFKAFTPKKNFCSLGSVKTNLGHSIMAAGVSGVVKMILSLKHKALVPSLNFHSPNSLINLAESPFKVQTALEPWIENGQTPRRGTVSSFGFSGTNVFAILEEYTISKESYQSEGPALILLSAQNKERLKETAENLKKHIDSSPDINLHDIAFTLQTGRKHMTEKRYIIADSITELSRKLAEDHNPQEVSLDIEINDEIRSQAISERNWRQLAKLWMNDVPIDWNLLYTGNTPSKISLPGYPFAKDTYWAKEPEKNERTQLHPLVHHNTSGFSGQQFTSSFTGSEFFFSGHKVNGTPILPGVAYLEMIRAATELSQDKKVYKIKNSNWIAPIHPGEEVTIKLKPDENRIDYEIISGNNGNTLKSKGIVSLEEQKPAGKINLQEIINRFVHSWSKEICYESFSKIGFDYGHDFRGIEKLFYNESEFLGKISLSDTSEMKWKTGLLDSVLQCCTGGRIANGESTLMIPFQLGEITFYEDLEETVYAHVRKNNQNVSEKISTFDIDVISASGTVLCSMKEFVLSAIQQKINHIPTQKHQNTFIEKKIWPSQQKPTRDLTIDTIREFVADIVKFEKENIKAGEDLMNYGFDSGMLILLADKINTFYKVTLTPALFYSYSTIDELTDFLEENHPDEFQKGHQDITESIFEADQAPQEPQSEKGKDYSDDLIAIVGISGRFPGCENVNDFWEKIKDEKNMITEVPPDRWDWKEIYGDPSIEPNKTKTKWGGFISDIDKFDALFFGISPAEAALMDPQQRIFIEEVYAALEDGGIAPSALKGSDTGVFVGAFSNDYAKLFHDYEDVCIQGQVASGTIHSILANRVSYLLDIHGPSEPIDTACSSSLIAIRRAVESIRKGRCKMAIAGGVNALLSSDTTLSASNAGMLSEGGNCRSFDASADGYIRSEGVGVVILKTLGQARKDNDHIYALIRGTAENHGGRANTLTSPNPLAQRDLLLKAYRAAEIDPDSVTYIEAHGTGTPLGDPIETEALKMAFDTLYKDWEKENPSAPNCSIGSVKSNIGHLESAAGMAGIIKVLLAMKHKILPGNPMLKTANPNLRLDESPFYLLKQTQSWITKNNLPRIAGVSSFGFGGVNAHIILEEYLQNKADKQPEREKMIVPLSAKDKDRLYKRAEDLLFHLQQNPEDHFYNIAFTLQTGREPMEERIAFIAEDQNSLRVMLENYLEGKEQGIFKTTEHHHYNEAQVSAAFHHYNLEELAQAWVNKFEIDWKRLYPQGFPVKISLPSYPFYRKRHWFQGVKKQDQDQNPVTLMLKSDISTGQTISYPSQLKGNEESFKEKTMASTEQQNNIRTRLYNYKWELSPVEFNENNNKKFSHIFLCGSKTEGWATILKQNVSAEVILIPEADTQAFFIFVLNEIKKIKKGKVLIIYHNEESQTYSYLSGLLKTMHLENPYFSGVIMGADQWTAGENGYHLIQNIERETGCDEVEVKIIKNERWIKKLIPINHHDHSTSIARPGGVYLITGGAGGIGKIFSEYLAHTKDVQVIITGRTPEDKINTSRPNIHYFTCDVSSGIETEALIRRVKDRFGKITGVIHGAGVIQDSYIVNKTPEEINKVFAPKIQGTQNLDQATQNEKLDFFILFSSLAAIAGNIGQADYASANSWMDAFAADRNEKVRTGNRSGRSISINWPLWKDGGMHIDDAAAQILEKKWGMLPMPSSEGISAVETLLFYNIDQGVAVYGNKEFEWKEEKTADTSFQEKAPAMDMVWIKKKTEDHLISLVCSILNYDKEELSPESELRNYGFSSYLLVKFTNDLNEYYGIDEPSSIFYNFLTISDMADFICDVHHQKIIDKHGKTPVQNLSQSTHDSLYPQAVDLGISASKTQENDPKDDYAVAIIGIAGRFPGADNVDELWEIIKNNRDAISEIPEERWDWKKYYGKTGEALDKTKAKWGGFINNIDQFDADYFNINPKEAEIMDPQQRITLETVYTALEDAGITPSQLKGSETGVYIGVMNNDYALMLRRYPELSKHAYTVVNSDTILANRISYLLDLRGPSEPVKTACSSALIAIHRAAEAIRSKECTMAIAGGVNATLIPETTLMISNGGMLSETGRCWSFDERAGGYVRSEGVGMIILKSLHQAQKDGDRIYGLIRGSEENHGGRASSLTAPNPKAQKDLLVQAYRNAGIDPSRVSLIEAHGTGTALGDPIEIEALKNAFKHLFEEKNINHPEQAFCGIGSIKANIGHAESASGVAGVIKVLMAMHHKILPGNPHLVRPNPYLHIKESPFYLLQDTKPWKHDSELSRIAGISSFGFGGSNAHVIIEEYPQPGAQYNTTHPAVILLSAKNKERLKEYARKLYEHIQQNPSENLHSIAYTLQIGREHLEERVSWIAEDLDHLTIQIADYLENGTIEFNGNTAQGKASLKMLNETFDENTKLGLLKSSGYRQLASLWCLGMKFDWGQLYKDSFPQKIKLPTYPFERKRYWPSEQKKDDFSSINGNSKEETKTKLVAIISKTINKPIEELDPETDFFEFGLDSVSGFELIRNINTALEIKIDFNILYEYTTIEALAGFIEQEITAGVSQ